jgi:hypothetical protein
MRRTYSLHNSTRRRLVTSPELLYRAHACSQRARSPTNSGVKAWKSSPRSIFCLFSDRDMAVVRIVLCYSFFGVSLLCGSNVVPRRGQSIDVRAKMM